jgi:hypothetical protein
MFDDSDPETLIARLCGPLAPADRDRFRRAAEGALTQVSCSGPGVVYRVVSTVWRDYFEPPDIGYELKAWRSGKLVNRPAIEHDVDGRALRYRKPKLQAVG